MKILVSLLFLITLVSISCTKKSKEEILAEEIQDETLSYILKDSARIANCMDTTFNFEYHTAINKLISLNKLCSLNKLVYNLDTFNKSNIQENYYYKSYSPGEYIEVYFLDDSVLIKHRLPGLGCNSYIVFSGIKQ